MPPGWWEQLKLWWAEFSLQTKLLAVATLVVSLMMTGITFIALNGIQRDARMSDTRFARDLGLLLSANVTPLVAEGHDRELAAVAERFWRSSRSLRYIFFADPEGVIYLGIPISATNGGSELLLSRRLELPAELQRRPQNPLIRQHLSPDGQVTDVFVPMVSEGRYLGVLALGINPNEAVLASAALTREVTVAVFISIWVLVILGAVFNALTITRPVKELLRGVRAIAGGDFEARIALPVGGELGELLNGFNDMASQLEVYDAANIEELTAAQVKQQTLIATMADGAALLDGEGRIVLVNPTARRLFRWEGRNLEGNELGSELPDVLAMELQGPLDSLVCGEKDSADVRCSFGEPPRTLRIVLQTVKDASGESLKGIAMTVQDLTREVELNAAQSRFISNVSHELRTPLFNIKSYVETLHDLRDQLSEEETQEFLAIANAETDRLTRLVNDVLDLSRLESDRTWMLEPMEVRPAMEQTLRNYRLNAEEKGVKLELEVDAQLPRVRGNWDLLLQVLDNLVGNGLKFTQAGGSLMLRAYPWPDSCHFDPSNQPASDAPSCELSSPLPRLRVEIADSGAGISREDQHRIFERFYRVENAVHTEAGTGLGLSIVRGILEKHGTDIQMASEPGVGTTFWFDLPLEQADSDELMVEGERRSQKSRQAEPYLAEV
ncbi:HAMP domain-containing protein [Synechococcus sp. Cruz-9H2]|uniref:HAMP domain-containing sensor histidine kinase n=1 Tax=unclassified Synechococcus TaxID=2626047 RepID=UPI0020CFAB15|nr:MULTISPECIES: ATP-binding protein [unclassified Synechococcus]MCP9819160.1 HAMP domain-containing protein [Synechococcus sp. Cruz-9H2]MCP9843664.1 HAMP domain-containing protein [Synechococcus sp. Edmonson 11F2]MCP9855617.1 HAMP domain-containing protein [Synechococcus sp. Cruz-9C9]MCP9863055.1 HAMP domain-containing protein [Synechococcus sp. Cruz-7E5]MCP9870070.1 HAMP domain-containing protein [Synechococcus sp. Cruz-7B9]